VRLLIQERQQTAADLWRRHWAHDQPGGPSRDDAGFLVCRWRTDGSARHASPRRDKDAYLHLWNVIGHQLGVCDELLVFDVTEANALIDLIRRRQFKASPEGQHMTRALLLLLDQLTPLHEFDKNDPPLIRHVIG